MNMRKHTVTSLIAASVLLLFTAGSSMAMCMGGGIALVPEKQAVFDTIMKDHKAKVEPIQNQLWAKETELNALQGNPKAEPAHIAELVKDAADLKSKLGVEHNAVNETLKKELGITLNQCGMMDGMKGGMMGGKMQHQGKMGGMHGNMNNMKGMPGMNMDDQNGSMPMNHNMQKKQ